MSIALKNLSRSIDGQIIVNNISLEIQDGEFFVLLGGSGSGKSTLLRMIAGLVPAEAGNVIINGRDVTSLSPQARDTGFVFQNYSIFRHLTVNENIEFGLRVRNVNRDDRSLRSGELLDLVGLAGLGERYPHQLSGGQQQRVALARALAYQPAVLLLDEPFGALDVKIRAQLRESLKQVQQQLRVTTIFVTHDQEEAFYLADRIGVIDDGCLVEVGAPETLYHRPRTELAASFLGGGNLVVGRIHEGKIRLGSVYLDLPPGAPPHEEGAPVRVLFRPESVVQQVEPFTPEDKVLSLGKGRVVSRSFLGPTERIRLEIENFQGVRALAPPVDYGVRFAAIDVTVPSKTERATSGASERWVGIRRYHVLDPTGLKVLIISDGSADGGSAWQFGSQICGYAKGPVSVVEVHRTAPDPATPPERLALLRETALGAGLVSVDTKVRTGEFHREVVRELQEGNFELGILQRPPRGEAENEYWVRIGKILERSSTPLLLVDAPCLQIRKVLLCTAGGEPGKADIRFGGRIARICGVKATVFHARREHPSPQETRRIERHMVQAFHFLQVMGVEATTKVANAPALDALVRESIAGTYDMIVVGAPPPSGDRARSFHAKLAAQTSLPILIVPMDLD